MKSIQLFEFSGLGYTSKNLILICIIGFPFKIYQYKKPENKKVYNILKGIIILFNITMKLIIILLEMMNNLFFWYLNRITNGKITKEFLEKNKIINDSERNLDFEQILFRRELSCITLNEVLVILNGEYFNSLNEFQEKLTKEFNLNDFKIKSNLLKLIIKEYYIKINNLKDYSEVYSTMKSLVKGMYKSRDIKKITLPGKLQVPSKK